MRTLLIATILLGTMACAKHAENTGDIGRATFAPTLGVDLAKMRQTPRGVYVRDLTVGTGAQAVSGSQVAIHYAGTLIDGKQFDANGPNDQPYSFRVNAGEVVPGFDEGVTGMKVGGRRQVIIPPALGYGARDNGPIPANSILVFTIELVSVQ